MKAPLNRRRFLETSGAVAVSAAMMPAMGSVRAGCQEDEARPVIYSAIKGGALGQDPDALASRFRELEEMGFDGIEGASPGMATSTVRQAIRSAEFPVHGAVDSIHWQQRLSSPDPADRQAGRDALAQALQDVHAVGGSSVLLVPGRVTGDDENHDHVWHRSIAEIRQVLPVASRLGIHILIENVWNGFCEDPQQFRDYLDEIGSPWVGAYFDIGNCRKFGPAEDWIRTLGSRIVKLDVKDWGQENGFCRLGEGDVDWPEVRRALVEIGFSGWATREGSDRSLVDTSRLIRELLG